MEKFESLDTVKLDIKTIDGGRIITISGEARGHKVYFKKIKREEGLEGHDYEAEIDGYDAIEGDVARKLFEKYYDLAKYKTRI